MNGEMEIKRLGRKKREEEGCTENEDIEEKRLKIDTKKMAMYMLIERKKN